MRSPSDRYVHSEFAHEYWTVFEFVHGSEVVYVKFEGTYESHYGAEYSNWNFVKPVPAAYTEWVAVL